VALQTTRTPSAKTGSGVADKDRSSQLAADECGIPGPSWGGMQRKT